MILNKPLTIYFYLNNLLFIFYCSLKVKYKSSKFKLLGSTPAGPAYAMKRQKSNAYNGGTKRGSNIFQVILYTYIVKNMQIFRSFNCQSSAFFLFSGRLLLPLTKLLYFTPALHIFIRDLFFLKSFARSALKTS